MVKGIDLTQGNETRVIIKFAIPMMIGNIFQQLYNVVDAAIVGKFVGKEALSAVGVSFPLMFLLDSLIIGFAIGGTILVSQFYGSKQEDKLVKTSDTLQIVLFFSAFVMTFIGIFSSKFIFKFMNLPQELVPLAVQYFNIIMIGNVGAFGYNALSAILRGLGDSKTPLYFIIVAEITNIIGDLILIVVFKMGVAGAAWATVISFYISYIIAIIYLNKKHKIISTHFKLKFDKEIFSKILKIGLPSSGQMLIISLGNVLIFTIINLFGTNVIASYSAASRLNAFAIMPAMFFSNALTAFVGQNFGAKISHRIFNGLKSTIIINSAISIGFTIIAQIFPVFLMKLFANDTNVIDIGVQYFRIVSPFYIVFSIMFSFSAVYRGMGNTIVPMYITFVALWLVRFPITALFSLKIDWSIFHFTPANYQGLWWGEPFGWSVGMIVTLVYFYLSFRKKIHNLHLQESVI